MDTDMDHSYAVGDKLRDLSVCNESGVKGILLSDHTVPDYTGYTGGIRVCDGWDGVVKEILCR